MSKLNLGNKNSDYFHTGKSILIFVDNLRVGGIQRQALDQMYWLSDHKISATLIVFDELSTFQFSNFFNIEQELIKSKNLNIIFCKPKSWEQIIFMNKFLRKNKIDLVIDYTLSGTAKIWLAQFFSRTKVPVNCIVQQLASLSAPAQRYKRMFMAQFSDRLVANSVNYQRDWENYVLKNYFTRFVFSKKLSIIRNGVYLPRLGPNVKSIDSSKLHTSSFIRFIFLGRLRAWKGLDNLSKLDEITNKNARFLIMAPDVESETVNLLKIKFSDRITFMFGKTPRDFLSVEGDVHVYAVNYGGGFKVIESVSTNCLEMALIGVPSLITQNGGENWPELAKEQLIFEVDWEDNDSIKNAIGKIQNMGIKTKNWNVIRKALSVEESIIQNLKLIDD